jgi:hypothetical protein
MNNPIPEDPPVSPNPQPVTDNRRRLRELLSVPERDRTDEQWDEIIELEIQLAPGNRVSPSEQGGGPPSGGGQKTAGGPPRKNRQRGNNRRQRPGKPGGTPV